MGEAVPQFSNNGTDVLNFELRYCTQKRVAIVIRGIVWYNRQVFNFRRYTMTLEEQVKAMLEALRPMLQQDGGDMEFVSMEGKTVTLRLVGHCGSCPYAMMTLKQGIETKLRELDPELTVERAV